MQALNIIVIAALNAAKAYGERIEEAKAHPSIKGKSPEVVRAELLPIVAAHYAVPLVDGERKAKGTKVLDTSAPKYEAAKTALRRLVADICGAGNAKSEEIAVPAHIAKLAKALADACNEYEGARKLAATAVAEAFAK